MREQFDFRMVIAGVYEHDRSQDYISERKLARAARPIRLPLVKTCQHIHENNSTLESSERVLKNTTALTMTFWSENEREREGQFASRSWKRVKT